MAKPQLTTVIGEVSIPAASCGVFDWNNQGYIIRKVWLWTRTTFSWAG